MGESSKVIVGSVDALAISDLCGSSFAWGHEVQFKECEFGDIRGLWMKAS